MIDPRFLIDLKGKQFVLYAGLLDLATRSGLKELTVRLLQVPSVENNHLAIAEAVAVFEDGRRFCEIGDAGPQNLSPQMAPAACRMAATRSKARVLRDALNVGVCSFEELGDGGHAEPTPAPTNGNGHRPMECSNPGCGKPLTRGQQDISVRAYGQPLCPPCQKQFTRIG